MANNKHYQDFTKSTFSGADISVIATLNATSQGKGFAIELGTVQTISCQSHRPKAAVRSIGRSYVKGYTRGPRTIAGSMVFTVLNNHGLKELTDKMDKKQNKTNMPSILADQLLPIDLTFLFRNEYGSISRMALYAVEFLNSGQTMSIEDLLLEEVVQFVARDMDPMADISHQTENLKTGDNIMTASNVFKQKSKGYFEWLDRVRLRREN